METVNKRIGQLIEHLKITAYEFSKKMGNSRPDTLYNLLNNEDSQPSTKTLNKIKDNFPEVNYVWLLTGEGEMLKNTESSQVLEEKQYGYDKPNATNKTKDEELETLKKIIKDKEQIIDLLNQKIEFLEINCTCAQKKTTA